MGLVKAVGGTDIGMVTCSPVRASVLVFVHLGLYCWVVQAFSGYRHFLSRIFGTSTHS